MAVADLNWIVSDFPGRLAIAARPRAGDWLEDEIQSWKDAGIDIVVSLLEDDEISDLDLSREAECCGRCGIEFERFPIRDRGTPSNIEAARSYLQQLARHLNEGRNVLVHCRAGIGRSGLVTACVLICNGDSATLAIQAVSNARKLKIPDTEAQRDWILGFAPEAH